MAKHKNSVTKRSLGSSCRTPYKMQSLKPSAGDLGAMSSDPQHMLTGIRKSATLQPLMVFVLQHVP